MSIEIQTQLEKIIARRRFGMKPGLETIRALLAELGNPHEGLKVIHVAGTNGKGATCAMLDAVLRAAGYKVARYTSPHLISINERFFINGACVDDERLQKATEKVLVAIERVEQKASCEVTFFEALTATAFVLFQEAHPDVVVLEAGLGGRLDATNVITAPLASVVTRIGLDHCEWLGTTYVAIASEKAGIVKMGVPVICGAMPLPARETIARAASLNGSPFVDAEEYVTINQLKPLVLTTASRNLPPINFALTGAFQAENAATVVATLDALAKYAHLDTPDHALVQGLSQVVWPGRFQKITCEGVPIYVDGAHNPDGACALRESLRLEGVRGEVGLVAGFCGDKDVLAHLRMMSALATHGWATPIPNARSLPSSETAERMLMAGFVSSKACTSLKEALHLALAWAKDHQGTLIICGSLFLAGEALVALQAFPWHTHILHPNERL